MSFQVAASKVTCMSHNICFGSSNDDLKHSARLYDIFFNARCLCDIECRKVFCSGRPTT